VATCIDRLAGSHVDVLALRLGGMLPLHCGAGPRVLLAGMPDAEFERFLEGAPFAALTTHTLTAAEDLRQDVAMTRTQGYTLSLEDVTLGVAAIGAPVIDARGSVVAAVSVAGLRHDYEGERRAGMAAAVVEAAAHVSRAIGGKRFLQADAPASAQRDGRSRSSTG
jgi:DNA-binding IclR family transcriptional regulator